MNKYGIYNSSGEFVLGHAYEVDVIAETYDVHDQHAFFVKTLENNNQRVKMGLVPLSATPYKSIVDEGRLHGSAKDFIRFKRNKMKRQGEK